MDFPGAFADHILPEQIHKINLSFIVNKFAKRRGGTAGNVSYSLGLLKTPHILYSFAGKDFGEYKKDFKQLKIDVSKMKIDKESYTATGFAMTDKTNNQVWGYFYGAAEKNHTLRLKEVTQENDLVLVGPTGVAGSMSMVDQCIKRGIAYMFDPGFILTQVSDAELQRGMTHAKYIIGNEYEMEIMKNRVPTAKKIFSDKIVITTLGEKGAVIEAGGKKYKILPVKVKQVVDPTGAGDAWRSGFLAGLEKGVDLKTAGEMGSVVASFVVEKYGCQEHTYTKKQFQDRYRQTYKKMLHL